MYDIWAIKCVNQLINEHYEEHTKNKYHNFQHALRNGKYVLGEYGVTLTNGQRYL